MVAVFCAKTPDVSRDPFTYILTVPDDPPEYVTTMKYHVPVFGVVVVDRLDALVTVARTELL